MAQTCTQGQPCLPAISSLFGGLLPGYQNGNDGVPYELGTVLQPAADGYITQLKFYKSPSETGTHVGHVWDYATQTLLAAAAYKNETSSGWQVVKLAHPLAVKAGQTYVVSYTTNGYFVGTVGGLSSTITGGYLSTVASVPNGIFGPPGAFPAMTYMNSNYFADLSFDVTATIFSTQTPAIGETTDNMPYELGARFIPAANGVVRAIRFWNTADEAGTHVGHLWQDDGTLLASVTFSGESGTGWHIASLDKPVPVKKGQTYLTSVNINAYYPDTIQGLAPPGVANEWLATNTDGRNGVAGPPGQFPTTVYSNSNYFRDVIFEPTSSKQPALPPWNHRGFLGWVRDLASVPSAPSVYWPDISIDDQLLADYEAAGEVLKKSGATEVEIWGLAAAGNSAVPGYLPDVEQTVSPARLKQIKKIIGGLHAKGLKVVAGMGGMSWGFDQIVAANPSIACPNSNLLANPSVQLAWNYQYRIVNYLMSFGVDGITVQSADEGRCDVANLNDLDDVQYHAMIVDPIASYIKANYPGAIVGSANYGVSLANPSDLPYVQQMAAHLDYLVDVGDTSQQIDPGYRAVLNAAIAPATLGSEADPNPAAPVHFDRLSWFLPMWQTDIANLQSLYLDGGINAENYMRMLANPSDEVTEKLFFMYEVNPSGNASGNLDKVLTSIYHPNNQAALSQLHDLFSTSEVAYFSNANSQNVLIEAYYDHSDTGRPYLRDNMSGAGRAAYRALRPP